jgi:WD40 repeat protein
MLGRYETGSCFSAGMIKRIAEVKETRVRLLKGAEAEVLDLAFSPDGRAIAAGFEHHPVHLWNLEALPPTPVRLSVEQGYFGGLQFSPDGDALSWRMVEGRTTYERSGRTYRYQSFATTYATKAANASADGRWVVSQHGMPDDCLIGWELSDENWVRRWTVSTADIAVESVTVSADGALFALTARSALGDRWADNPRQVEVWDGSTGRVQGHGAYSYGYAPTLRFSPDATQLVGINDMTLLVWPVPRLGEPQLIRNDNRKDLTAVAFHPSGQQLYATSNDETVHVFDVATWERVKRFTWQIGKLKSIAVSPDGMLAAAGGENGAIVIWDLDV